MSELDAFLRDYRTSRSREYLLTTRLIHDLSTAAAASGYDLLTYIPTVDADGFDVIFDDRDRLVPVQLKSVVEGGKAASWQIHRNLLRPEPGQEDLYGFVPSPEGQGRGGGVILTWAEAKGSVVSVRYSYTDIDVLSLLWLGLLPLPEPQRKRLENVRIHLGAEGGGTIPLPRSAFLSAKSPLHLLALAGLRSSVGADWRYLLQMLLRERHLGRKPSGEASLEKLAEQVQSLVGRPA
jgi:hypothetical protein